MFLDDLSLDLCSSKRTSGYFCDDASNHSTVFCCDNEEFSPGGVFAGWEVNIIWVRLSYVCFILVPEFHVRFSNFDRYIVLIIDSNGVLRVQKLERRVSTSAALFS